MYQETAIQYLEENGWDVERFKIYGLPLMLKVILYPVIWVINRIVREIADSLIIKGE